MLRDTSEFSNAPSIADQHETRGSGALPDEFDLELAHLSPEQQTAGYGRLIADVGNCKVTRRVRPVDLSQFA